MSTSWYRRPDFTIFESLAGGHGCSGNNIVTSLRINRDAGVGGELDAKDTENERTGA